MGPTLLAGIGQVTKRYADIVNGEYIAFGDQPKEAEYDYGFAFVLPVKEQLDIVDVYMARCRKKIYMTICETETVNPAYGILTRYKELWVSSYFCKNVFQNQFPEVNWKVLPLYAPPQTISHTPCIDRPYVFYTIGNILDPRKNIRGLIDAFLRCAFPAGEAILLLKATCVRPVDWKVPGVQIINGLLSNEDMEKVHAAGDCYVNCSHSEGVGMGAVEAAMRKKPIIIGDYGGLKEYVHTPFMIKCKIGPIGFDDFLFTKELEWGHPSQEDLMKHLKSCFNQKLTYSENDFTEGLMAGVPDSLRSIQ